MQQEISLCPDVHSSRTAAEKFENWQELAEFLTTPIFREKKEQAPLWSPAIFSSTGARTKEFVLHVNLAVIDLDHATKKEIESSLKKLASTGISFLVYSTFRHTTEEPRLRVVIPLASPIYPQDFPKFWARLITTLFPFADPQCKDSSRFYYLHSAPPGAKTYSKIKNGRPLELSDLADISANPTTDPLPGSVKISPTSEMLNAFATRLLRSPNGNTQILGQKMACLAKGHAFAQQGEGDTWIFRLTSAIVSQWPDCDPEETAALFAPSLSHGVTIGAGGDFPLEKVAEKIARHKENKRSAQVAKEQLSMGEHQRACMMAWQGTSFDGRSTPYTEEELENIAKENECLGEGATPAESLEKRWIIQHASTYYVLTPRGYREVTRDALVTKCLIELAPAISAGVELYRLTERGKIPLTVGELMSRYGREAERSVLSLLKENTRFDARKREIVQTVAPIRSDLKPKHNAQIEQWLKILAGDNYFDLLRWLYFCTDLSIPCAALFLHGERGTGKSLLPCGVAALWGRGKGTELKTIADNWTQGIADCPLVVADEEMPANGRRGGLNMAWFRELIQAREHTLRRKNLPDQMIRGAVRVMIVAQKEEVLYTSDHLTGADAEAISERIAMIEVNPKARDYLNSLPNGTIAQWAKEGIARHILAIPEQIAQGRFLVKIDTTSTQRKMVARSQIGSAVVQFLVTQILNADEARDLEPLEIHLKNKRGLGPVLRVLASGVSTNWTSVFPGESRPRLGSVANVLDGMSSAKVNKGNKTYFEIDLYPLADWARSVGMHNDLIDYLERLCRE